VALRFFVGNVISGIGLGFFGFVIGPWAPIPKGIFLLLFFNYAKSVSIEPLIGILAFVVSKL